MSSFRALLKQIPSKVFTYQSLVIYLELSVLILLYLTFAKALPKILEVLPATGGDMGSHYWPLVALREYGFPNFNLRIWNPGNYAGEPLLVHYFPLPFLFMTCLSYFMPPGLAFNIVTFAPAILIAPAVWWAARFIAREFGASREMSRFCGASAAVLSLGVFYNDGNSMWGGNVFSLLAGQFAHQWAFVFFILWMGAFPRAIRSGGKWVYFSALMLAFVVMSHGYVAIMMPVAMLGLLFVPGATLKLRIWHGFVMGAIGSALSAWFWWPLIDNSKWTTPYGLSWSFSSYFKEIFPVEISQSLVILVGLIVLFSFRPKYFLSASRNLLFWIGQLVVGIACVPILATLGVVNVRTIPHVHYILCLVTAYFLMIAVYREGFRSWTSRLAIIIALAVPIVQWQLIWPSVKKADGWITWNYSGWTVKSDYKALMDLSDKIRGTFNDPRVAFEHTGDYNGPGTPRVFEMLPYFSGRSTTDGLYMQSTILAPFMFYNQATISAKPSCPFPDYDCTSVDFAKMLHQAPLLGVDTFILFSDATKKAAAERTELQSIITAGPWNVFKLKGVPVTYADTLKAVPSVVTDQTWRRKFWDWFKAYQPASEYLIKETKAKEWQPPALAEALDPQGACKPKVQVNFNHITLETDCPGKAHVLKFAFHDSWRASGGENLALLSPGYLGIIPKSSRVDLRFGQSISWILAGYISFASWIVFLLAVVVPKRFQRKITA